jgi:anti-repressor protein
MKGCRVYTFFAEVLREKGLVNLTKIAKHFGKQVSHWLSNTSTQEFLKALEIAENENPISVVKGGKWKQGTWVTREASLEFAQWISPSFKVFCIKKLDELFQTGKTQLSQSKPSTLEILEMALEAEKKRLRLEKEMKKAIPKINHYDTVADADNLTLILELAKTLPNTGPKKFYGWLRENGYLFKRKNKNLPYQEYINNGWFKVVEQTYKVNEEKEDGNVELKTKRTETTKLTGKGVLAITRRYLKSNEKLLPNIKTDELPAT